MSCLFTVMAPHHARQFDLQSGSWTMVSIPTDIRKQNTFFLQLAIKFYICWFEWIAEFNPIAIFGINVIFFAITTRIIDATPHRRNFPLHLMILFYRVWRLHGSNKWHYSNILSPQSLYLCCLSNNKPQYLTHL